MAFSFTQNFCNARFKENPLDKLTKFALLFGSYNKTKIIDTAQRLQYHCQQYMTRLLLHTVGVLLKAKLASMTRKCKLAIRISIWQ